MELSIGAGVYLEGMVQLTFVELGLHIVREGLMEFGVVHHVLAQLDRDGVPAAKLGLELVHGADTLELTSQQDGHAVTEHFALMHTAINREWREERLEFLPRVCWVEARFHVGSSNACLRGAAYEALPKAYNRQCKR